MNCRVTSPALSLVLLPCFFAATAFAQEYPTGPEAGAELAAQLRSLQPEQDSQWSGSIKVSGRDEKLPPMAVTCRTTVGQTNWSVTYATPGNTTMGPEQLTVIHSTNGPNQYLYARAASPGAPLGEAKSLAGAAADVPLADSDFWLSDLGLEFLHWPQQNRLKGELRRGRSCFVLESLNPHPAPGGYARVKSWIEKESGVLLQAEAYGADKKLIKTFEPGSFRKVSGHWEPAQLDMRNRQSGSRTFLEFDVTK